MGDAQPNSRQAISGIGDTSRKNWGSRAYHAAAAKAKSEGSSGEEAKDAGKAAHAVAVKAWDLWHSKHGSPELLAKLK
jgi:hypothetical protein